MIFSGTHYCDEPNILYPDYPNVLYFAYIVLIRPLGRSPEICHFLSGGRKCKTSKIL